MNILHLPLKKKFFDMILSGEKKEEYREIKMYWAQRLMNGFPYIYGHIDKLNPDFKDFDQIIFKNGYGSKAPTLIIEFLGIKIGQAKPEWSDNWQGDVFVINLGNVLETKNIK